LLPDSFRIKFPAPGIAVLFSKPNPKSEEQKEEVKAPEKIFHRNF